MSNERLIYLPLGGAGEIGMNAYVYGYGEAGKERLVLVDLGVTFPDMDGSPGVDLILPDISWLRDRRHQLEAIIITHAHEDHIGAVGHHWADLGAPIYARAFTANIARRKMDDAGQPETVIKTASAYPEMYDAGPFKFAFAPISHSIPESSAVILDTPAGRIVHSGDFKIDETPVVGEPFDRAMWREIGDGGVHALMCDSTNIFSPHAGRSEASIGTEVQNLISNAKGMVVATTFASNVARLKTLATAADRAGRSICLMGRAMRRMIEAAIETGVLTDFPKVVAVEDAADVPRENLMLLVTGSQGERRAATAQLANGKYNGISLKEGDLFLFSSKTIPGNERAVIRIVNQFSEQGVDVVDDAGGKYHVSGHANRPDLEEMHELIRPKVLIPMHGEHRHLREHVKLAATRGIKGAIATNGTMLDITGDAPKVVDHIETGRIYLDGKVKYGAMDGVVRDRIRIALNGLVIVTLIIDEDGAPLGEPWCELRGLPEMGISDAPLLDVLEEDLSQLIGRAGSRTMADDDELEETIRRQTRNTCLGEIGKKPEVSVIISRLM